MKSIILSTLSLVMTALFLNSCASGTSRVYASYPPKQDSKSVQILQQLPQRPYTLIADFDGINMSHSWIQSKAASYGADAVYIASFTGLTTDTGAELRHNSQPTGTVRNYYCSAIKYKNQH
jgi:hypothetical protein